MINDRGVVSGVTLTDAVTELHKRLNDADATVWSRSELRLYIKDGYDTFCDRARVLFGMAVIPNTPPIGSYGTDLQKYLGQHSVGVRLEDNRLNVTQDPEYQKPAGTGPGGYAGSYDLPVKGGDGELNDD